MSFFSNLFGGGNDEALKSVVNEGAFLVDVRTPSEFAGGSVKGAVNIPLDTIGKNLEKFKNKKNIVVFCRSGNRSGQAQAILKQNGISNVLNGGTWEYVNGLLN
jgi:rhodanese-related sulfurtransferase